MNTLKTTLWATVGLFALAALVAMPASADQVILDDLIVDGSLCVGLDCVNGESFGFETIRIKENNLRIRAFDTSSTASFPSVDWQLTFNESSNGGQNKFSIDDLDAGRTPFTIEASAPSHSLYVDDGGRLGFGTSTPVADLHVKSGNTPTLRLEQDGSSGFTAQTWDVAGNEANFFIRDATNGSTLPIRLRPGAPTSAIDIAGSSGNVGFGTSSPAEDVHVQDSSTTSMLLESTGASQSKISLTNTDGTWNIINSPSSTGQFRLTLTGLAGNNGEIVMTGRDDGNLTVENGLEVIGLLTATGTCSGCDAVFQPEWPLETIEEHAELMYANSYLPAVGPTPEGEVKIDVFGKTTGILQELEKAHIYIAQLNATIKKLEARLDEIDSK